MQGNSNSRFSWLDNYPEGILWDAKIDVRPIYDLLARTTATYPKNIAIDFLDKKISYSLLKKLVDDFALALQKKGFSKGDKIALILPNCPQFVVAYYAITKIGAIVVNCNPLYTEKELSSQLKDSDTKAVITVNLALIYNKVINLHKNKIFESIIVSDFAEYLPCLKSFLFKLFKSKDLVKINFTADILSFEKLLAELKKSDKFLPAVINANEDVAVLQYTGGTTGVSKGAMLTHANIYANTIQTGMWFVGVKEGKEIIVGVLPLFHVFAMTVIMNLSISKGCVMLLHPKFDLKLLLKDIIKKKPTVMPGVPSLFAAICHYPLIKKYNLSSLERCISGGAPLLPEVKKEFEKITGCTLIEGYGLTETSPVVSANPLNGKNKTGSIGLPFPQTIIEIRSIDEKGELLPIGEVGELCIMGPQVMKAYYKDEKHSAEILCQGALRTGDVGYMDNEGYFFIVDRIKDMIIINGFNVYSKEVEVAISLHPAVLEVAVIGIKDENKGQAVKACIVLRPNMELTKQQLTAFLKEHLVRYKIPTLVEFRDKLPKTTIGKISKKDL